MPTGHRLSADCWPTVGRQLANTLALNIMETVGHLLADSWPTVGQQYILGTILHYYPVVTSTNDTRVNKMFSSPGLTGAEHESDESRAINKKQTKK